jgi:hypothetical protein
MKKQRKKQIRKDTRGSTLSFVAVMVLVLSLAGIALLRLGLNARMQATRTTAEMSARSAADAGLIQAIRLLNTKLDTQEEWDVESLTSPLVQLPNCRADYRFKLEGDVDEGYEIVSVGRSGNAERTVHSKLKLAGLFDYAIFVADDLTLMMGTTVDAYNLDADDPPLQIATNTTDADALDMKTGVTIEGDVLVGPDGDPDVVIDSKLEAVITGETYTLPEEWDLPVIKIPNDLFLAPSKGIITGGEVITTDGKYDGINLSNGLITLIDGDISLYILGKIELDKLAQIQLPPATTNPDAKLTIYLGGNFVSKNGGIINNDAKDATKLTIFGLETCTSIEFLTECTFYGAIYAPYADVKLYCAVEVFGAIVADSFLQSVEADFHYDASLQDVDITDIGVSFDISRWWEQ